ncbi:MAG: membrane protein insertase YidC [Pseudorhodobacter sp.]|nr:membrane protein insertase YidC [Pseudorhodobacter sp.]
MDDQNKNLILATALSFAVILIWLVLFPPEEPVIDPNAPAQITATEAVTPTVAGAGGEAAAPAEAASAQPEAPRLSVETPRLKGSLSLLGGRFDDLSLKTYRETLEPSSEIVTLLSPVGKPKAFYALYGWTAAGSLANEDVPGPNTLWTQTGGDVLAPGNPVQLSWNNGKGLVFTRDVSVDALYMFSITQSVRNNTSLPVSLAPYGIVARHGLPDGLQNFFVLHEGVVGRVDGELEEVKYKDIVDLPVVQREAANASVKNAVTDGWIGFTDKYWMTTLIPEQGTAFTAVTKYVAAADIYQTETRKPLLTVAPGATVSSNSQLFAGAKEWETIRNYQNDGGIAGFIDSIDWGWFFFFTKPIFSVLHWLNAQIGNMGLAIIALTFLLKALVFPLAYKSYVSMARMKELQPEMEALKERVGEDKQKMQQEMMKLYKEKKVNPAAGCLPILIQIPIFFSLYKVIFVTIELRHAPFFGWLTDLSAPDTSSLFNLFGLFPWAAPENGSILALIFIGVLPLLLGVSMWLQQKLNPTPTDPTQAMIFAWMPWVFMFMLGSFASGLVVYWITNNVITFTQQYAIMKSHGHTPDLFGNIKASFKRKPAPAPVPEKKAKKKP